MSKCSKKEGCNLFFNGVCQALCGQPQDVFVAEFNRARKTVAAPVTGAGLSSTANWYKPKPAVVYKPRHVTASIRTRRDYLPV
jgi:hypothetical protein